MSSCDCVSNLAYRKKRSTTLSSDFFWPNVREQLIRITMVMSRIFIILLKLMYVENYSSFARIESHTEYAINAMNMMRPIISPVWEPASDALYQSKPPNLRNAAMTPNSDPPAINPDAISVPRENRALSSFSFLERVVTHQETMPPMTSGVFSSCGIYMPSANASGEMLTITRINEMTAPTR